LTLYLNRGKVKSVAKNRVQMAMKQKMKY